jgi:hypothetical protein
MSVRSPKHITRAALANYHTRRLSVCLQTCVTNVTIEEGFEVRSCA